MLTLMLYFLKTLLHTTFIIFNILILLSPYLKYNHHIMDKKPLPPKGMQPPNNEATSFMRQGSQRGMPRLASIPADRRPSLAFDGPKAEANGNVSPRGNATDKVMVPMRPYSPPPGSPRPDSPRTMTRDELNSPRETNNAAWYPTSPPSHGSITNRITQIKNAPEPSPIKYTDTTNLPFNISKNSSGKFSITKKADAKEQVFIPKQSGSEWIMTELKNNPEELIVLPEDNLSLLNLIESNRLNITYRVELSDKSGGNRNKINRREKTKAKRTKIQAKI